MNKIFADVGVGRKNIVFGVGLFLLLGVVVGIPLTINFFGGSVITIDQYRVWKVVHGYGIFLGFINYFLGLSIDRLGLTRRQKELSSWSFVVAGLFGGVARMALVLFGALDDYGIYASLGEAASITLGTAIFVIGQAQGRLEHIAETGPGARRAA